MHIFAVRRFCMECGGLAAALRCSNWRRPTGSRTYYLPKDARRNNAPKSTPIPNENVFSRKGTLRL